MSTISRKPSLYCANNHQRQVLLTEPKGLTSILQAEYYNLENNKPLRPTCKCIILF